MNYSLRNLLYRAIILLLVFTFNETLGLIIAGIFILEALRKLMVEIIRKKLNK